MRRAASLWVVLLTLGTAPGMRAADPAGFRQAVLPVPPRVIPVGDITSYLNDKHLSSPLGLFFDETARELFLADSRNDLVAIFDAEGMPRFSFGAEAGIVKPRQVMADEQGRIYVIGADRPEVQIFSYRAERLGTFPFRDATGPIQVQPVAMALSPAGRFLFADQRGGRILIYDRDWSFVLAFGHPGKGRGAFRAPVGLAVGPDRAIYVVDRLGVPVQVFSPSGRLLRSWGAHELGDAGFSTPGGVAVDRAGRVYVADTLRQDVKVFSPDGTFLLNFGGFGGGPGQMAYPVDVAASAAGRLYVCEKVGARVQLFRIQEGEAPGGKPPAGDRSLAP
ncbi:MAG: NHL repeat-containing protein [Acidobacteriota bacterium]